MLAYIKEKKQNEVKPSPLRAFLNKHAAVSIIVLALILLTAIPTSCFAEENSISWTQDELAFMNAHPVIRVGVDPEFVPFEFIDKDGRYKGISADYLDLISEKTGLQFEVMKGLTWPEAYDKALDGDIDLLPAVGRTVEREERFILSEPYYYYTRVIVTRASDRSISDMEDLVDLTVAVQRNSSHHSYLLEYPSIHINLYDSVENALAAVATGKEKAYIGNIATVDYIVRSNGLTNLRIVAFETEKQQALHFAVRRDWPELAGIIDKAVQAIPESVKLDISKKWVNLETHLDYWPIIRMIIMIGVLIAVVMSVSFFWIARLKKEIRRKKQIQADLEQAKREADEANAFKSSFLARMSHEIRTPLHAITGMSYLLKKTQVSLTQSMYIDRITQAASNMLGIINDILDFSKIEAGKVTLETASFSMDQVIQDVVNIVSYKIEEQGIGFRVSKDPQIANWFFGDSKRIEQILLNVLNNAVKFTSAGEVSLDVRLLVKENDKYHIAFTIKDTGIGMSEEQIKKLFTPFEQGDISINRRFGGSGLGLSIVKNLLDMMGGDIKVFSTPGEGSTFFIRLVLPGDKEREALYSNVISEKKFSDVRTLVLEKSGANINLIVSYLESFGMYCELTNSETSALAMLEAASKKSDRPFDLFIIDYDTPANGGLKFIEALRSNKKITKFPKIILLLPLLREDLFDKLNDYDIDLGIGKPIIPSVLFNGILDLFNLNAAFSSQPAISGEAGETKLSRTYRVLLAEDNKTNRLIAESLLKQVGIETIVVGDGREAVEQFQAQSESIDLVLMDLHMPVMNGYEAAGKIRELSPRVPLVAMTADVIMGVRDKCEECGITHYISKPFNPEHFIQTIKDILLQREAENNEDGDVLNRQMGINNMGDNTELYNHVLEEYRKENRDTLEKLEAAISDKRYEDAAQIVHKVKSSSGSIGAAPLQQTAVLLQKALNEENDDEIKPLYNKFARLLKKLLEELNKS